MKEVYVSLPGAEAVQRFVGVLNQLGGDFELVAGQHILDARSLMGIFSFDLEKPILLRVYKDTQENLDAIRPFLAETEEGTHEQ